MKSAILAMIRRSLHSKNGRVPSCLHRSSSSNSSTGGDDGGSSRGETVEKDISFVSAGNVPNNLAVAVNESSDVEVGKVGPKEADKNNRSVDFDEKFSDLSEIERILSLPSRSIDPKKKQDAVVAEYEFFRYSGHMVPSTMTEAMWKEVSLKKTVEGRLNIYILFFLREKYQKEREKRKLGRTSMKRSLLHKKLRENFGIETPLKDLTEDNEGDEDGAKDNPSTFIDGLSSLNSTSIPSDTSSSTTSTPTITSIVGHQMFITQPISPARMRDYHEHNLTFALQFGQPLFLDLSSLPAKLAGEEFNQLLRDIQLVYLLNKSQWEPFNVHLCGYNHNNFTAWKLAAHPHLKDYNWDFIKETPGKLIDKEKIVYITPHSPHRLRDFRHDDVYILDCSTDCAATMAKAKEIGCRTAKIDHQRFFSSGGGGVWIRYGFRDVFRWLIDARDTGGNWLYALRRESRLIFRPEFAFAQQFLGFQVHGKINKGWVETDEMENNSSHNSHINNGSHNNRSRNNRSYNNRSYNNRSYINNGQNNSGHNNSHDTNADHSHSKEPSQKELEQLLGRSVLKPSLENTLRILQVVRLKLKDELVRDDSSSCVKPLIETEAQLNNIEFVLQELTRWQKTEKQWLDTIHKAR